MRPQPALALALAAAALVAACGSPATPPVASTLPVLTPIPSVTRPPIAPSGNGASFSMPPASFPDQSPLPSGQASAPPLVAP